MMTLRIVLPAVMLALCSCQSVNEPGPKPPIPGGAVELSFPATRTAPFDSAIVPFRSYSHLGSRQRLVVRSATEWADVWNDIIGSRQPPPALPPVDFSSEMVVVAAMGARGHGGYDISIPAAFEHDGVVYVSVRESSPADNCITTQAVVTPIAARLIPSRSGPVVFSELASVFDCSR